MCEIEPVVDTAEIRIWRHFRWSAFVTMAIQTQSQRQDEISPRVQAPFSLCTIYVAGKCIEPTYQQASRLSIEFLGQVLTSEDEHQDCLEFVIFSRSRWPHGKRMRISPGVWNRNRPTGDGCIRRLDNDPSPEISHHTVCKIWLFIAYSDKV